MQPPRRVGVSAHAWPQCPAANSAVINATSHGTPQTPGSGFHQATHIETLLGHQREWEATAGLDLAVCPVCATSVWGCIPRLRAHTHTRACTIRVTPCVWTRVRPLREYADICCPLMVRPSACVPVCLSYSRAVLQYSGPCCVGMRGDAGCGGLCVKGSTGEGGYPASSPCLRGVLGGSSFFPLRAAGGGGGGLRQRRQGLVALGSGFSGSGLGQSFFRRPERVRWGIARPLPPAPPLPMKTRGIQSLVTLQVSPFAPR